MLQQEFLDVLVNVIVVAQEVLYWELLNEMILFLYFNKYF